MKISVKGLLFAGLTLLCALPVILKAQEKTGPYKFKPVRIEEVRMTTYEQDTSADAVILGEKGESHYEYDDTKGFVVVFTCQLRIKILKQSGTHWANQEIGLYREDQDEERMSSIKGTTYNLEGGKLTEDKLKDDAIFEEKVNRNWTVHKLTMPNVRVGSVIDLKYTVRSPYIGRLRSWDFQSTIPVQWSEYEIIIPEYFHFSSMISGYVSFVLNERTSQPGSINRNVITRSGTPNQGMQQGFERQSLTFTENVFRLATQDVPALKEEPYVTSIDNYLSSIEFELESYQFPGEAQIDLNTTWDKISEMLLKDPDFGDQLKRGGVVKDVVARISGEAKVPFDKMLLSYDWAKNHMKWNGSDSKYPTTSLRDAMDKKSGNSADINLMLILLLKELGLQAEPVVLSTRDNGELRENHPMIKKMNYVIAWVKIDDQEYLLDATDIARPWSLLPFRCLNGKGWLVLKENSRWVTLLKDERNSTSYYADLKLLPDGTVRGSLEVSAGGYSALDAREDYLRLGKEEYISHLKEEQKNWEVEEVTLDNMDDLSKPVTKKYQFSSEEIASPRGNLVYLNVLIDEGQKTNPFQLEKREYPVNFGDPVKDVYTINLEIPEGYQVETLPEPARLVLIDQAGSFRFMATAVGNKITVSSILTITRPVFLQSEYPGLREFFNMIVKKHAQQIVLKKI
jgi:hypothetical protein